MTKRLRLPGFYVALIAMLFRALLPIGWMPNVGATHGIPIVLCSVDGPVLLALGADGKPIKPGPAQGDTHQHDVCPFAAAPHLGTPVDVAVRAPVAIAAATAISPPERLRAPSESFTPQSPRGPPRIG
jgi:hypothetical protein